MCWSVRGRIAAEVRVNNTAESSSIGIGGHVNPDTPELLDGLEKELEEEVGVEGDYDLTFAGILNDDTTEVGSVHLGAVFVLESHELTLYGLCSACRAASSLPVPRRRFAHPTACNRL